MSRDANRMRQVQDQCKAVAHMARALAEIHDARVELFASSDVTMGLVESIGRRTADLMEVLGDILNGMDAASEEDEWIHPIMKEAQRIWPSS